MTLDDVRIHIDSVDRELKQLIERRMELAHNVADAKIATGDKIFKPDRESQIISGLTYDTRPDIIRQYTALIRKIMLVSREYQYSLTLEHLQESPVAYVETSDIIKTITISDSDNTENAIRECINSNTFISSFSREDNSSSSINVTSELIGNTNTRYILLCIDNPDYTGCITQILNIIADFDIRISWLYTGKTLCCIELNTSITNILAMTLLFMLTQEQEALKVIGSY